MKILDNINHTVREDLQDTMQKGSRVSIAAACFSIYAYQELKKQLEEIAELRFIFTSPTFVQENTPKERREFYIPKLTREKSLYGTEFEVRLRNELTQKALAKECADWVRRKVKFRSNVSGEQMPGFMTVGESSYMPISGFTTVDLGCERGNNAYYPVQRTEAFENGRYFLSLFDEIWNDSSRLQDVTDIVLQSISTAYRENSPDFIYFFTLYNIFSEFLEDVSEDNLPNEATGFKQSKIWNMLYDFQRDAALAIIHKLEQYNGCILADSVGLGKTFTALAVIKYYENRNKSVLVLCPKKLAANWNIYKGNYVNNPLVGDRFRYDVLYHTDLSRSGGTSNGIDLAALNWGNFDLVVIDESHNFRNGSNTSTDEKENRYTKLMNRVIRSGVRTKVLMLSATPVNNRLLDLRNQIELITEGDDAYLADTDGIESIAQVCRTAQARFNEWSKLDDAERTTESFVNAVNADYFKLLDVLTIARSRKHISKYYGAASGTFPQRRKPLSITTPIDLAGELPPIAELNDMIAQLTFAQYQLLSYVRGDKRRKYEDRYGDTWGKDFESQVHRTGAVANLMRVNVLKRMESSVNSFRITLSRILAGCEALRAQLNDPAAMGAGSYDAAGIEDGMDDDDAEEIERGGKVRVDLRDVDALRLGSDLDFDITVLHRLLDYANAVTPERDAKLDELYKFIADKVNNPYNPGNRKVLVFTAFADTADYLFEQLAPRLKNELGLECAEVAGSANRTYSLKLRRTTFENILAYFSPRSKELPEASLAAGEIDVVFATDCISEGQNLQDCDCLVNYDIHWNPVRIIQRFGRIDRLGSTNTQIQLVDFWPDIALDEYIQLESRVKGRMALLDASATGEENVLESKETGEMNDLKYRRQQLQQLKSEVLDLEDISGGISITDFAFDDFRVELQRYEKEHPGLLENSPAGMHAVARIPDELRDSVAPGVVFCLAQNDENANPRDTNPTFPYYVVYVSADGDVMTKHTQPKHALDMMRACCAGESEPIAELCRDFNRETRDGERMGAYTELLDKVVATISGVQQDKGIESLFSLGEVGTGTSLGFDDYSLISFAVLR